MIRVIFKFFKIILKYFAIFLLFLTGVNLGVTYCYLTTFFEVTYVPDPEKSVKSHDSCVIVRGGESSWVYATASSFLGTYYVDLENIEDDHQSVRLESIQDLIIHCLPTLYVHNRIEETVLHVELSDENN